MRGRAPPNNHSCVRTPRPHGGRREPGCGLLTPLRCRPAKPKDQDSPAIHAGRRHVRRTRKSVGPASAAPPPVSQQLADTAPTRQLYGFNLIVCVGLRRYHHLFQREEIRVDFARPGISLSDGSVSAFCDRLVRFLAALLLDATRDQGQGELFLCLGGWCRRALHVLRIRSESPIELQPTVQAAGNFDCHFRLLAALGHR